MESLISIFEEIIDKRNSRGKLHCLTHILVICVVCILKKAEDISDIYDFAKENEKWFNEKLKLWNGIPSEVTIDRVLKMVPAERFLICFLKWIDLIVYKKTKSHIAIDGKAIRAATEKAKKGSIPYIVSAYLSESQISIGEVKIDEKSNEITAIPNLLKMLDINGCVITIDAIGTQEKIMEQIVEEKGADFVLALKENQKDGYDRVKLFFDDLIKEDILKLIENSDNVLRDNEKIYNIKVKEKVLSYRRKDKLYNSVNIYATFEKGHGREEKRIYIKSDEVEWFNKDKKWRHVKSVIKEISYRIEQDVETKCEKYYVCSYITDVVNLGKIIRGHWSIENNLHWVLDICFKEDLSRIRKNNGLENMALIRKIAYNLIKLDTRFKKNISTKRKMNIYNQDNKFLEELLFDIIPKHISNIAIKQQ